ncbi:CesD/SycD/LcrH family type III secretion system chaperone [Enterobacterales bacterium CwR94]|nr:CesD/SycD/LcrH family type III secretion system chaperone [Enterobacterales bacterium CwR94]
MAEKTSVTAQSNDDLAHFLSSGGSLRMLTDTKKEDLDTLYDYAVQLFDAGDYPAAQNYFYFLCYLDKWDFNYLFSLGRCYQKMQQHEEALVYLVRAGLIRVIDPRPSFFAGISYQALGNNEHARRAWCSACRWCAELPQYEELKSQAIQLLEGANNESTH